MSAPHRPDFERPRGMIPGVPHAGAVLALAAAVFVGTLLAVFSASSRAELGGWWAAAMAFAIGTWLAAALVAFLGCKLSDVLGAFRSGLPRSVAFIAFSVLISALVALAGAAMGFSLMGVGITAIPFALAVAYFWSPRVGIDPKVGAVAGVVLFLICIRLFTMQGRPQGGTREFPGAGGDDIGVLSWNVGGGAPGFSAAGEGDIGRIAQTIKQHSPHIVCLQEVPSEEFVEKLRTELGSGWRGIASEGSRTATAVLSRIGGMFEAPGPAGRYGGPSIVRIASERGDLHFVSCHAAGGRDSKGRRTQIAWLLSNVRSPASKTVIAGDFNIDPEGRWSFLRPLLTDSASFDRASWRAIKVLGPDPGIGGPATTSLGRRSDWVVVDSRMEVNDYKVLTSARRSGMDHAPVFVSVGYSGGGREVANK